MIAKSHIFFNIIFLTFHMRATTAELDPAYRVAVMNDIFNRPGWHAMAKYQTIAIVERPPAETESAGTRVLHLQDLLKPDRYGKIVNYDNVDDKVRQAHQLLSCWYGHPVHVSYEYGTGAARQCEKIDDPAESLKCVRFLLDIVREIDGLMSRLRGMFSCLYRLGPATAFDTSVCKAVDDFHSYYDHLTSTFDGDSFDKQHHSAIIASTKATMAVALQRVHEFCGKSCILATQELESNGISIVADVIRKLEAARPPIDVIFQIKNNLHRKVKWYVTNYHKYSLGLEYDPVEKTTRIMYNP